LDYLSSRVSFVSLADVLSAFRHRNFSLLPKNSVLITLDDGYQSNYDLLPLIKEYSVRPVIYLSSQIVNTCRTMWSELMPSRCHQQIKRMPASGRKAYLHKNYDFNQEKEYPDRRFLSQQEIMEMTQSCDFGSHTRFHQILTTCDDRECFTEISLSKNDVESLTGRLCTSFSYPNGDYSEREIAYVKEAGYQLARTIDLGWNDVSTNPYRLKALGISDKATLLLLKAQLTSIPQYMTRLLLFGSLWGKHKTVQIKD
jgi:peptidoglycan/xylan/chitin deacetylase (PgdA/CDA1 family)